MQHQEQEKKEVTAIVLMAQDIADETGAPLAEVMQAISLNGGFHRHVPADLVESLVTQITESIKMSNEHFPPKEDAFPHDEVKQ